jgi:AmmeMemoRadiSam system protein A
MKELVKIARKTLENFFDTGKFQIKKYDKFKEKKGVFVTIHSFPENELRGCIGLPQPEYSLFEAVQIATMEAAFSDPRFPHLKKDELNKIIIEISVLTLPKIIEGKPDGYLDKIKNGKDGLILEHGLNKGLLLPQVWEEIPDKKEFLEMLCWKASLTPDYWFDENTKLYKFQVKIFREKEPNGEIEEINLEKR